MGLYGHLLLVPPALPSRLLEDAALRDVVLFEEELPGDPREWQVLGADRLSLWSEGPTALEPVQLPLLPEAFAHRGPQQLSLLPEQPVDRGPVVERLDIDRAWHALHFLLTDSADAETHPLSFLAAGGRAISEDLGNGPLRAFSSLEVRSLAKHLAPIHPAQILEKFDPARLEEAQIYGWPSGWRDATLASCGSYLTDAFVRAKAFVLGGAERGRALLVYAL